MPSLHFLYASTSGSTEHVIDTIAHTVATLAPDIQVEIQKAENAQAEDLLRGDVVILGSGTWNTGGKEGQLNMYMHQLLMDRAKDVDLQGKPLTFISLGDERYYFRTRCTEHFLRFQREHGGILYVPPLILVNEPYGQEQRVELWAKKLIAKLQATPVRQASDNQSKNTDSV